MRFFISVSTIKPEKNSEKRVAIALLRCFMENGDKQPIIPRGCYSIGFRPCDFGEASLFVFEFPSKEAALDGVRMFVAGLYPSQPTILHHWPENPSALKKAEADGLLTRKKTKAPLIEVRG